MKKMTRAQKGLTLIEVLVATLILSLILMTGHIALLAGQSAWSTTDTQIRLQESLRQTLERVGRELQESGSDNNGASQVSIMDGTGPNATDALRFSIPLCVCGNSPLNANGDIANWGAPLNWGWTSCPGDMRIEANGKVQICHLPPGNPQNSQDMEVAPAAVPAHMAHGDWLGLCSPCSITGNKFIEYRIDANAQLLRQVLDSTGTAVRSDIFAANISDFQAVLSADQKTVTLTVSVSASTSQNRQITASRSLNIYLRNRG
jgi:prepilin-type N-terminal cleavage/methylation domain-containing protein